jgi:hypothetical protein
VSRRARAVLRAAGGLAGPAVLARLGLPAVLAAAAVALAAAGLAVVVLAADGPARRAAQVIAAYRGTPAPPALTAPGPATPPASPTRSRRRWRLRARGGRTGRGTP